MCTFNITKAISQKKMSVNKIKDFILNTYCKRNGFSKENGYCSKKRLKKKRFIVACEQINKNIPHLRNTKIQSVIYKREKHKISKQSEIIT